MFTYILVSRKWTSIAWYYYQNGSEWFLVLFLSIEMISTSVMTVNASLLRILCWCLVSGRKQSQTMAWQCCVSTLRWLLVRSSLCILVPYCEAIIWHLLMLLSRLYFLCVFSVLFYRVGSSLDFSVCGEHPDHYVTLLF